MSRRASDARKWSSYLGKSGHLAVMAEFAVRGYNVAMPEIDRGDDVFVVNDSNGDLNGLSRVQVKTTRGVGKRAISARFTVSWAQLEADRTPDLQFVFVIRRADRWHAFFVIDRETLNELQVDHAIGVVSGGLKKQVKFNLRWDPRTTRWTCGSVDFTRFLNNWRRDLTR